MKRDPFFPSPRHEIDRLFDALIHTAWGGRQPRSGWNPAVDVTETPDQYRLEMDLPGVRSDDFSITAERGLLRIEGVREPSRLEASGHRHMAERPVGRFVRTFELPSDADADAIRARLVDGVLTVTIPRQEHRRPR